MSQSHSVEFDDRDELDPLLAFNAELSVPEFPEKPTNATSPAAALPAEDALPLRQRLEQAEQTLERTRTELASLKSDLQTLVTSVDDIKKRLNRRPAAMVAPPVTLVPHRSGLGRPAAIAILFLTLGVATWGVSSVALIEISEVPPIETEATEPPPAPAPVSGVPIPAVELPKAASLAPVPPPIRRVVEREPQASATYVGTLAVDATPGGEVFINRQLTGRTPMRAENLRAGSHLIWIEREGYRRWTSVVAVGADRVTRVRANLDPLER